MRIATVTHNGATRVGRVDSQGERITFFDMDAADASRGALPIIERMAAGGSLPATVDAPVPLGEVTLLAPLPRPRRNLWCVGRNYHAHAKELQASVFKGNDANPESWPIVFTKVP